MVSFIVVRCHTTKAQGETKDVKCFSESKPIIGMVNLKTTLGYRGFTSVKEILDAALIDAEELERGGVDGILVENSNDFPPTILLLDLKQ